MVAEFVTGERDVSIRVHGLEDAARLSMGNFIVEESEPVSHSIQNSLLLAVAVLGGSAFLVWLGLTW